MKCAAGGQLVAVGAALLLLAPRVAAIDLALSTDQIERALKVARSDEPTRAAFHRPYVIDTRAPAIARLEVVTELRRLVLIAEDHVARGDMLFTRGTREASESLHPWRGKVSIGVTVKLDPRNAYLLAPPVDISLQTSSGVLKPNEQRSKSIFDAGAPGARLPVIGANAEADFAAASLAHTTATLVIGLDGTEIARTTIAFEHLR